MTAAAAAADRNLLFGILALQMDFINRDQLIAAMHAWVLAKARPLGPILVEQGALSPVDHSALDVLVTRHLERHGNDPERSLAALASAHCAVDELEQIADPDVQASLSRSWTTRAPTDYPDATPGGPVADAASEDPNATRVDPVGPARSADQRFRILRPHAQGGLGKVSVALDEELHREVALKEIQERHADDPNSRWRFLLEAEVTGRLEHPGIVPVYGLGAYADGRPFYAMRLIKGDSLREAIDRFHKADVPGRDPGERTLGLRELLGRFIDVCNAVAYAHSRGVLHRDIKPANIMLGKYGETLVLDWGLAKPVGHKEQTTATEEPTLRPSGSGSAETVAGEAVGTPQYMSPEQAAGRLDLLGPASDVYSLGATLYSLLTGQSPFTDGDIGAVIQKVQRGEFPLPRQVKRSVPPALEAICLKAMALRSEDRYGSPRTLADDIEHWLADEPVAAHQEPLQARLRRWGRRHRTLVITGAVMVVTAVAALSAGLVLLKKQAEVVQERNAAQRARDRAAAISKFYEDYVLSAGRSKGWASWTGKDVTLKEILDRATPKIDEAFAGQPELEAAVRDTLGMTYWYLGLFNSANPHLERAYAIRLESQGPDHPDTLASLHNLARQRWRQGRLDEAVAKCRQALEGRRRVFGPEHEVTLWSQLNLGIFLSQQSHLGEAQSLLRRAIECSKRTLGPDHHHTLYAQSYLACLLEQQGKLDEADRLCLQTLRAQQRAFGKEHPNTLLTQSNLARVRGARGDLNEAEKLYRRTLDAQLRVFGPEYPSTLLTKNGLAKTLGDRGKLEEAEELCRRTVAIRRRVSGPEHPDTLRSERTLANLLKKQGHPEAAEKLFREVLGVQRKTLTPNHLDIASTLADLGWHLTDNGRSAEAEQPLRESLEIREKNLAPDSWLIASARCLLGSCLVRQRKFAEAESLLLGACEKLARGNDAPAKQVAKSFDRVIELYEKWGRPEQAEAWRKKRPPAGK
jgi:serine/threonine protein kinase/tetratricopeptide (TPR) repeat protein